MLRRESEKDEALIDYKEIIFTKDASGKKKSLEASSTPKAVAAFVKLITEGEQDLAEALLQKDVTLALLPGDVTDLSGRTFKDITGFQYAVWALDWHMWTMILKYLPADKAAEQIEAMESGSWVSQHYKSGDWLIQNLVDALQEYIDLRKASQWDKAKAQWQKQVGGAQCLLPVHVINEYCHPNRPFEPCPDFTQPEPLPRTRKIDEGEWFTAAYNDGKLGEKFAVLRYSWDGAHMGWAADPTEAYASERQACHTLLATRTQQRDQLVAELSRSKRPSNNIN